jgi:propanol-preferring alcohol dehydrogenase
LETCGICHTDVHIRSGQEPVAAEALPLVLGHEGVGRIVEVGPAGDEGLLGTRVGVPWIHDTCGQCRECLSGWESYCGALRANGFDVDGAFAEYCVLRETYLVLFPEELDPVAHAPLLCAGVTALSAVREARLRPGSLCAVFGIGGLGQYGIQLARAAGAVVAAIDTNEDKLEIGRRLGADHVFAADADPGQRLLDLGGADACINFAPTPHVWDPIMKATHARARIVSVALVDEPVPLSLRRLTFTGEHITGVAIGGRQEIADVLSLAQLRDLRIDVQPVGLSDVDAVLDDLGSGAVEGRCVVDLRTGTPQAAG